jgi:hypothetical protein
MVRMEFSGGFMISRSNIVFLSYHSKKCEKSTIEQKMSSPVYPDHQNSKILQKIIKSKKA